MAETYDAEQLIHGVSEDLQTLLPARGIVKPVMVGIHTGGVWVANRLHSLLGISEPLGGLDIAFYRDDFTRIGIHPQVRPSSLPFNVDDRDIILVDDVLHTGRTIRAALNEIFDYGRPSSVILAVLVERAGRELPIQADVVGQRLQLAPDHYIELDGPQTLRLRIKELRPVPAKER
jgi:pyrimidine operon attenuation protein/uracil phosphoribosyltransferase